MTANSQEISTAYRELRRRLYPNGKPTEDSAHAYQAIERAYRTLRTPRNRKLYHSTIDYQCLVSMNLGATPPKRSMEMESGPSQTTEIIREMEEGIEIRLARWRARMEEAEQQVTLLLEDIRSLYKPINVLSRFRNSKSEGSNRKNPLRRVYLGDSFTEMVERYRHLLAMKMTIIGAARLSDRMSSLEVWQAEKRTLEDQKAMMLVTNRSERVTVASIREQHQKEREERRQQRIAHNIEAGQQAAAARSDSLVEEAARCNWQGDSWEMIQKAMVGEAKRLIEGHEYS